MGRINRSYLKDKFLSTKGYKRNSPDVNNPYNVIPSNQITMEDVDFPVMGIDDLGNQQLMQPGKNYTFPGNYVTEFPLRRFQSGGTVSPPIKVDSDQYTSNPIKTDYVNFGNDNPNYSAVKWDPEEKRLVAVFEPVDIVAKRKKGFFTRWKSKSQQARENYSGQDNLRTDFYRKPDEVLAGEQQARNRDIQNKLHGTLRETTDEDRQDNRNSFTFVGQAAKRKGSADPIDYVLDLVNPAAYYYMGKDALSGVGQTAQGIYNLDPEQVGSGLLQTGLNAAAFLPALKSIPSAKSFSKFARLNPSQYKTLQGAVNNPTEYLTTQTPLKNTYKINPWAFKPNPEAYYRSIGKEGLNDALESGVLRPKQPRIVPDYGEEWANARYTIGKPARGYEGPLVEITDKNLFHPYEDGLTDGLKIVPSKFDIPLSNPNIKFYKKDWLRGYKPVEVPKQSFKSEIDWAKWNPDTPKYPELINEYNAIEQSTKKAGTWMKNPDGSPFQGTPEQFIQQQSSYFKKAFPEYHGEILNHNTNAELNTIDESFFNKATGDGGFYGKGTYTHPNKEYTKPYGKNNYEFYLNSKNKGFLNKDNIDDAEYFKRSDDEILQHHLPEYENRLMNYELNPNSYSDNAKEIWLNKLNKQVKAGKISRDRLDEFTSLHNPQNGEVVIPFNNRVKSAIGNVGFFDMTNPNIYKGVLPYVLPIGAGLGTGYMMQNQKPKGTYQMGGTIGIPRVNGQVISQGSYPLNSVRKLGSYNQSGNGVKRMPRKAIKNILDNMR